MDILLLLLTGILLIGLLAFRFRSEQSRFEINRLAEHNKKYRELTRFLDIYPGLLLFVRFLALVMAILLTGLSVTKWGIWAGGAVACGAILVAWLIGRLLHGTMATIIERNLALLYRYFAWTGPLGRLVMVGDEPQIGSETELLHLIDNGDFLDDHSKNLVKNTLNCRAQTVKSVMTPRADIGFIHSRDSLTPKLLDELFSSGHKVFPVINGSIDHTVGLLYLDDVLPLDQQEKSLADVVRKVPPVIDQTMSLEAALQHMAEYHSSVLLVAKDGKVVGMVTLSSLIRTIFS